MPIIWLQWADDREMFTEMILILIVFSTHRGVEEDGKWRGCKFSDQL